MYAVNSANVYRMSELGYLSHITSIAVDRDRTIVIWVIWLFQTKGHILCIEEENLPQNRLAIQ